MRRGRWKRESCRRTSQLLHRYASTLRHVGRWSEQHEQAHDLVAQVAQEVVAAEPAPQQAEHPPEPAAAAPAAEQPASNGVPDVTAQDLSMRSEQREPHKHAGSSERREEHRSSRPDPSSKAGRDKDPEREREELANDLIKLTSHVAFVDIRK
jgi:hypothetical protein